MSANRIGLPDLRAIVLKAFSNQTGVLIALVVGFGCGVAWEHRGPGRPPLPFGLHLDGPFVQRDAARAEAGRWRGAFLTERNAYVTLMGAVDLQNAAAQRMRADSLAWQARSDAAVVAAQRANAWRLKLADRILATPEPAGEDFTTACKAAEAALREGGQ